MSDYQRLVSYIYSYPGGTRDKNVGFAKAEVRNGQFKLNVSLKGVYTDAPENFGVYLLVEDKEESASGFALLHVGDVIVNGGAGQYADLLNPTNISGSGYRFENIGGIAIARQDNSYYRMFSLWRDSEVNTELVKFLPKGYKKPDRAENEKHLEKGGTDQNLKELEKSGEVKETDEIKAGKKARDTGETEAGKPSGRIAEAEEVKEMEAPDELKGMREEKTANAHEVSVAAAENGSKNILNDMEKRKNANIHSIDTPHASSTQRTIPGEMGGIFDNADFIDVFDDDYYYDCIEVTPEQLQKLPIEDKSVVSNSFLEHGYYNFKHLLFGKVRDNERHTKYFIGVPGMYCNRERFMATMFGYGNFKRSHRADCSNPYFGYWYQEI